MTNGDTGVSTEVGQVPTERDLGKELATASEVGKIVLAIARERGENPKFSVRRYTMPMLDQGRFPREEVRMVLANRDPVTGDDIKAMREASVVLAVEAAAQIVEAIPPKTVSEDSASLEQMLRMVRRGSGLAIQTETSDPQMVIKAGKGAMERRKVANGLNDQDVLAWTKETFTKAQGRLSRMIRAIDAYHGR